MINKDLFEYMTRNRKLKLEEYDDDGNLIDSREFSDSAMFSFIHSRTNDGDSLSVARINDLNMFTDEELEIVERIIHYSDYKHIYAGSEDESMFYWFTPFEANKIRKFLDKFNNNYDMLNFALDLSLSAFEENSRTFNTRIGTKYSNCKFTLSQALNFIKNRDGIYYTVNNNGERIYDFVDKPTKKQVKYQRTKNGNRTVFLSFKDWKQYIVEEDSLI